MGEKKKRRKSGDPFSQCPARLGFSVRFWALRNARSLKVMVTTHPISVPYSWNTLQLHAINPDADHSGLLTYSMITNPHPPSLSS